VTGNVRYKATQFVVTYDPPRLWCQACQKVKELSDLTEPTIAGLKARHRCGPAGTPWNSSR